MGPRDPTATSPADPGVLDELRLLPELYGQIPSAPVSGTDDGSGVARDGLGAGLIDSPHYDALSERAADKSRVLLAHFGSLPEYADAMLAPADVLEWYFEDCHGLPVPMDLDGYAKDLGMNDSRALCRLLLHDLLYEMLVEDEQAEGAGS